MIRLQLLKLMLYSKTKHIICNLTQFEPIYVWKQFLFVLFLLTMLVLIIFLVIGDDISSDPLVRLIVVPESDVEFNYDNDMNLNKLIDLLDFKYLMTPSCNLNNIDKILLVTSFAGNIESRSALRRAYPDTKLEQMGIKRVFMIGLLHEHQSDIKQNALINENKRFSDLLQGNFYEAYRNLTYKHIMGLKWASESPLNCNIDDNSSKYNNKIKYIIKMDDDIIVDLYKLTNLINSYENNIEYDMMGYVLENVRPIRLKANKWYVTKTEYDSNIYPTFLSGWLYVTKPNVAKQLVQKSYDVKYFWIDDVYVTGVLGNLIKVKFKDIHNNFTLHPEFFECCIRDNISCYIIAGPNGGENDLQIKYEKHVKKCLKENCPAVSFSKHQCITQRKAPSIGKGFAELKMVKL